MCHRPRRGPGGSAAGPAVIPASWDRPSVPIRCHCGGWGWSPPCRALKAPALYAPYAVPPYDPRPWVPVLNGVVPKATNPSYSTQLRSPGSVRKLLTHSD